MIIKYLKIIKIEKLTLLNIKDKKINHISIKWNIEWKYNNNENNHS